MNSPSPVALHDTDAPVAETLVPHVKVSVRATFPDAENGSGTSVMG